MRRVQHHQGLRGQLSLCMPPSRRKGRNVGILLAVVGEVPVKERAVHPPKCEAGVLGSKSSSPLVRHVLAVIVASPLNVTMSPFEMDVVAKNRIAVGLPPAPFANTLGWP